MNTKRRAFTLIELLVVVTILVSLIAITLPLAKKLIDDSYTREASRQLNAYFAMAKIQAVRTGRPWGLYLQCDLPLGLPTTSPLRQVTKVYLAEVQPPYAGSTIGAKAEIYITNAMTGERQFVPVILDSMGNSVRDTNGEVVYLKQLIEEGEQFVVRFDYKGEWYRCQRGDTTNPNPAAWNNADNFYYIGTLNDLGYPVPPGFGDNTLSYAASRTFQILRGPRRVGNPLELTSGCCIDVAYCGVGPSDSGVNAPATSSNGTGFQATTAAVQALTVMFTAAGGVEGIYVNTTPMEVQGTVHFLVGRVQKINSPQGTPADAQAQAQYGINMFDPESSNLADPTSLWVSVSRSTGTVTTSDNLPPSLVSGSTAPNLSYQYYLAGTSQTATVNTGNAAQRTNYVGYCRLLAASRDQKGGL